MAKRKHNRKRAGLDATDSCAGRHCQSLALVKLDGRYYCGAHAAGTVQGHRLRALQAKATEALRAANPHLVEGQGR